MTSAQLKTFLDSLVTEQDRDFAVEIRQRAHKRTRGVYIGKGKIIRIYGGVQQQSLWLILIGIHELAHHLNYKTCREEWYGLWRAGRRVPHHGKVFKTTVACLIRRFNIRHSESLGGLIIFDARHATRPPRFDTFK